MFGLDAMNSYFLVVAMAALLVAILVWQPHRSGRTVVVWLASGAAGVVLEAPRRMPACDWRVMSCRKPLRHRPQVNAAASTPSGMAGAMPQMGESGCPLAKGYLTSVVQKLDLLTGDIGIKLTAEQAADVVDCLKDIETPAKMSNGDAKAKYHRLASVLNADQKCVAVIELLLQAATGPHGIRHAGHDGRRGRSQAG